MAKKRIGTIYQKPTEQETKQWDYAKSEAHHEALENNDNQKQALGRNTKR